MTMIDSQQPCVIIAAYNEASVIGHTLETLTASKRVQEYQVIVVCNGCSDATEQIVNTRFPWVHCLSMSQASKSLAIRYAESFNPGFPRLYLDADISLSADEATQLINLSRQQHSPRLIIPASTVLTERSSSWVRSFYRVWYRTPYVKQMGYGAGAYLMNETGRARFGAWPQLTADDALVRRYFSREETHIETTVKVQVNAPKTLWSLIKVKTRSKYGNLELNRYQAKHGVYSTDSQHSMPKSRTEKSSIEFANPQQHAPAKNHPETTPDSPLRWWHDTLVYMAINTVAFGLAKWQFFTGSKVWFRDNSNR